MTNKCKLFIIFVIIINLISCNDDTHNLENNRFASNDKEIISDLISFGKDKYTQNSAIRSNSKVSRLNPEWNKYELAYSSQRGDTLLLIIPLTNDDPSINSNISISFENGVKKLSFVSIPKYSDPDIPYIFRQRVAVLENGIYTIYKIKYSDDGVLRLFKMRNPINQSFEINTRASTDLYDCFEPEKYGNCLNGGWLPEVIVIGTNGSTQRYPTSYYEIYGNGINIQIGGGTFGGSNGNNGSNGSNGNNGSNDVRPDNQKADKILQSEPIKDKIKQVVQLLSRDTSPVNGRRERGFWIYYNSTTGKYVAGSEKVGNWVTGGTGTNANIESGSSSPTSNGLPPKENNVPVTFYHRHSPVTNLSPDEKREVDPSQADKDFADKLDIQIIVTDYIGTQDPFDGKYYIHGGTAANAPTKEYIYKGNNK